MPNPNLYDVYFLDGDQGWTVGDNGTILHTKDGGDSWEQQTSGIERFISGIGSRLVSVQFIADGKLGWAVGQFGTILHTTNGGESWKPQASGTKDWLESVQFLADDKQGWAAGSDGTILHTEDGGERWKPQVSGIPTDLSSIYFLTDGQQGWAVGQAATNLHTTDGGLSWTLQASRTIAYLDEVYFLDDGKRGWAVGEGGTILNTTESGISWKPQESGTIFGLNSVQFLSDGKVGWAVGEGGTILITSDGGNSWHGEDLVRYGRYPAWWLYPVWMFTFILFVYAIKTPQVIEHSKKSVADMLLSDRPLEAGEPDFLAFKPIARGLSMFLRNKNTQPPLTIAITGEWGTGKSSLMNLLKDELKKKGIRPVWFNAWHHQKEEHLLASLLENIRVQAIPSWFSLNGLIFRACLIFLRTKKHFILIPLMLLAFIGFITYFAADYPNSLNRLKNIPYNFIEVIITIISERNAGKSLELLGKISDPFSAFIIIFLVIFILGWRLLSSFGVKPAALMVSMSNRFSIKDLSAQTSFRHKFAQEFREVTQALKPRTMLILIDDLDRCRPENVLEVLEAVNFLVSSGDCFVVLGMSRDRVERCVGLGFKDIAKEMIDSPMTGVQSGNEEDEDKKRRSEFARHYLEKLINIEIPVPKMEHEQSLNLLKHSSAEKEERYGWFQGAKKYIQYFCKAVAVISNNSGYHRRFVDNYIFRPGAGIKGTYHSSQGGE